MTTNRLGVGAVASAVVVALASCGSSASAPTKTSVRAPGRSCAWPSVAGVHSVNVGGPDSAAAYWFQPLDGGSSSGRITVSGTYPDARYFSLSVYTPDRTPFTADGVSSSLSDYRIAPELGSTNPWRRQAPPGGRFQVTISPHVARGQSNVLPLPPGISAGHPGYLVLRVYLPASGNFSQVTLPVITVTRGRSRHTLPDCRDHSRVPSAERTPGETTPAARAAVPPPAGAFYKPRVHGAFANSDATYAAAYVIRPPAGDVLIVTAKAPTSAPGSHPSPWPRAGEDMRYWSMCIAVGAGGLPTVANRLPGGQTDYGCRADKDTKRNAAGDYAYVIGSEAQRAAIARIPDATFLPFSSTLPAHVYLLWLRDYLVNPSFTHSTQNITRSENAPAAAAAMGPYYPRVSTCALSTLRTKGVSACAGTRPIPKP